MTVAPPRVTMINKYYPPHVGGIEFHMRDLAEGLVTHAGAQVRALVCNGAPTRVEESIGGVDVVRLPRAFEFASTPVSWGFSRAIAEESRRAGGPDVLHCHFPYPWGEISWLTSRVDMPTVVTYHSDIVRQKASLALYRPFLERFLDGVDLIIASSPNMIEHSPYLRERAHKCRHVDFGLDVERIANDEAALRRAQELRAEHAGRPVVLFVGRLVYYKGVEVLVRAMASVDADLVMIGKGPLEEEIRSLVTELGLAERVRLIPSVDDDELAAWYHAADVFALPSIARSEAFGLVQIEAHAAGTPVVSTNLTTGVPYANLDGETGLIVPVGDHEAFAIALNRILSDDALRKRLGERARERALADFNIPRMVESTVAVYREAIELHARGRV